MVGLAGLLSSTAFVEPPQSAPATAPVAALETDPVRDTEPEAIVAAAELNQPVEVLSQRGEYRDVFAQPDGTLIANEYNQAVRVLQGETWVSADATLVAQPDGTSTPRAALLNMRLSGGGTTPLMVVERDSRVMTLTWPNPLPAPTLSGDQAIYPEVFQDVDLVANVTVEGFSHVLVLKTPEAANLPELQNLRLGVTGEGLTIQETEDGGVVALDPATGNPVMEAGAPTMWDSGGQEGGEAATSGLRSFAMTETQTTANTEDPNEASARGPGETSQVAQVGLSYSQGTLSLTPDAAMLADPTTTYPVYVDPVWQSSTNSAWAMVDSGYPSEEYWKFDGKRHERIGLCPSSCNSSKVKRLFYQLATPYAGKTILEAKFRVTLQHVYNSTARAAALYLMPSGISSSTNWGNQPGGSGWSGATHLDTNSPTSVQSTCTSTNQNTEWDAKVAVQQAVVKGWSNVTLGLRSVSESDSTHTKRFCDNGVLSVRYNRAPVIANQSELTMSPGGGCVYGPTAPYTDVPPRLNAILRDPDHSSAHTEQIKAEFKVTWTPTGGTPQTRSYTTPLKASGSLFNYYVPTDIAQNVPISWEVRASDGVSWGPWSSDGSRNVCQFYYDKTSPSAPDVDSPEYLPGDATDTTADCLDDDQWRGSIGVQGSFTFDSAATDVVEYQYNFNDSTTVSVKPATAGGPVTIKWTPDKEGPRQLFVKAIDLAKRSSTIATCTFRVGKRPPIAQWPLSDIGTAKVANDQLGSSDARIGSGVKFDQPGSLGKWDTSATFDGTSNAYLVTDKSVLTDTGQSFSITGWFRVDDINRRQVAVSQDGTGEPGFSLGVDQGTWFFRMPTNDVINLGEWKVTAGPVTTDWTFITAVFDGPNKKISLQIGAGAPVVKDRRSLVRARGALQLGRHTYKGGGYSDFWKGGMADVSVFDRPVVNEDVTGLEKHKLDRKGYWQLSTQTAKASPNYDAGGEALLLGREDSLVRAANPITGMMGQGYLLFKGQTDQYAETATPLVDPAGSFTITARVRFTSGSQNHPMTAISIKGANNSSVVVIRGNADGVWEMAATTDTGTDAVFKPADHDKSPSRVGKGDHIALVYNGYSRELLFYLNGQPRAVQLDKPLPALSSIQFGRAFINGVAQEHLSGAIDDVRVYNGMADKVKIDRTSLIIEQPNL
ncbi:MULTISPECIES: LamG-like jellyroll fold domain-containing protein [unclassified Micromonospora]|uniref:LamG-like jellyroll fold domain-containing protein n=1 Tax=unclassified Micromonospora TaxID=2617518 RepID=UPI002FF2777F